MRSSGDRCPGSHRSLRRWHISSELSGTLRAQRTPITPLLAGGVLPLAFPIREIPKIWAGMIALLDKFTNCNILIADCNDSRSEDPTVEAARRRPPRTRAGAYPGRTGSRNQAGPRRDDQPVVFVAD